MNDNIIDTYKKQALDALDILIEDFGISPRKITELILYFLPGDTALEAIKSVCEEFDCEEILN